MPLAVERADIEGDGRPFYVIIFCTNLKTGQFGKVYFYKLGLFLLVKAAARLLQKRAGVWYDRSNKNTEMSGIMKKFIEEFKAFALRGNVMDMAVGVLIGSAFSGIVTSLTENFINPVISLLTGAERYTLQDAAGFASNFASSLVNFLIMALILFCMMKGVNKLLSLGRKPAAPAAPTTKKCPYCLSDIPIGATRCPHCTSQLEETAAVR